MARWDFKEKEWQPVTADQLNEADTVLLPCSEGGYSKSEGWTGNVNDQPDPVQYVRDFDDRSSCVMSWVTLAKHSQDTANEMQQILDKLNVGLDADDKEFLLEWPFGMIWEKLMKYFRRH